MSLEEKLQRILVWNKWQRRCLLHDELWCKKKGNDLNLPLLLEETAQNATRIFTKSFHSFLEYYRKQIAMKSKKIAPPGGHFCVTAIENAP